MKKWLLKAIVQKGISFLPGKHQINYLFQRFVTRGVQLRPAYLEDKLVHFQKHAGFFRKYRGELSGRSVLELGTGWYPVIPLCLYLEGAGPIFTVDISRLTNLENIRHTAWRLLERYRDGSLQTYVQVQPARLETLTDWVEALDDAPVDESLGRLGIRYLVADARQLPLPDDSLDLVLSNNTFEHIYPEILAGILQEFQRVVQPNGLMSHFIDMSDHFAHLDPSITIYHFLRFSKGQWAWVDNSVQPQNRWRLSHYRRLYERLGIPITLEENRPGSLTELAKTPVHADFAGLSPEELAISHSYVVSAML